VGLAAAQAAASSTRDWRRRRGVGKAYACLRYRRHRPKHIWITPPAFAIQTTAAPWPRPLGCGAVLLVDRGRLEPGRDVPIVDRRDLLATGFALLEVRPPMIGDRALAGLALVWSLFER